MPTYLLQWEAIRWAKARGCAEYDLWGVPDEDEETLEAQFESRHDGLWGVYRFKRGFGGQLKRAAQALDRVYNPLLYWIYLVWIKKGDG
jgi:lipid II:glycine glycyltransferase (peptidoglycan interpeptide bridge formation enzyme)